MLAAPEIFILTTAFFFSFFFKFILLYCTGALHGDDVGYVFKPSSKRFPPRDESDGNAPEVIVKSRMVRFIANFVKYG